MTIREAFAKAGYPVPVDAMIGSWTTSGLWFYSFEGCSFWFKHPSGPWVKDGPWDYHRRDMAMRMIKLDNLPAVDALDALPECVRKVLP